MRRDHTHVDDHVDEVNGANILSRGVCVCVKMKTRQDYLRKCALCSVDVDSGERIVRCHASINVVIGVRVMEFHAIIHVVIGVRVMLCHQAIDNSGFSTFLNFPLRAQILILISSCINSSSLFPCSHFVHTCTAKTRHVRCCLYTHRRLQ